MGFYRDNGKENGSYCLGFRVVLGQEGFEMRDWAVRVESCRP